ncbi:MAG: hypothetical protein ACOCXH_15970 [Cyclobacteriaceae bacterium]
MKIYFTLLFLSIALWSCQPKNEIIQSHQPVQDASEPTSDEQNAPQRPGTAPAMPGIINYEMPNGYMLEILITGDEFSSRVYTADGYLLLENQIGYYEYAVYDSQKQVVRSGITALNVPDRSASQMQYLLTNGIQK